jgi:translocation and assembly module TamB
LSSKGSFTGIGLRAGLRPDLTAPDDKGVLRLGGEWNIESATQGRLHIVRESGDWVFPGEQPMPLGLRALEFTAHAGNGRLTGELTAQGARLGEWHASVTMPLAKSATGFSVPDRTPLTGHILINIPDLAWLAPMMSDNLRSGGKLALKADVTGTYGSPALRGQVRGDDLAIVLLDQGLRLQQGQLLARFDQKSLHIDTLSFIAPHDPKPKDALLKDLNLGNEPGRLSASGILDLSGKNGSIDIIASHLPLSQRPDRWIIASGSGYARLNNNQLSLGGTITADAGLIGQGISNRPQLSDDVVITGQQQPIRKGPHLSVDASLNLGEHFYLRSSGLEARLSGQLSVRDAQDLKVTGSIATRDANFEAYGQKLTVQRGIVNFQGPLYDPGLNILAVRRGLSVEAGVAVTGTALHPAVKLVSTPDVPDVEKLSWIVLGRAPSSTGSDSSLLLAAAGGILGGSGAGITGQIKQALGVDELSLGQDVNSPTVNNNPLSSQIVTVGKRLSSRAFISYAQGITAVAGVTKLTYTLTPRVNIVTQAGMDNAIDIFYTFSFD